MLRGNEESERGGVCVHLQIFGDHIHRRHDEARGPATRKARHATLQDGGNLRLVISENPGGG